MIHCSTICICHLVFGGLEGISPVAPLDKNVQEHTDYEGDPHLDKVHKMSLSQAILLVLRWLMPGGWDSVRSIVTMGLQQLAAERRGHNPAIPVLHGVGLLELSAWHKLIGPLF